MYGLLADAVVAVHVGYVAYVLLGQLAIVLAAALHREWGRNRWFRLSHLLAMAVVAYEALAGLRCPLSVWEEQLRALAGQSTANGETFMGRLLHDLLFIDGMPEVFFTTMYVAMFVVVVQAFVMYPPRLRGGSGRVALDAGPPRLSP